MTAYYIIYGKLPFYEENDVNETIKKIITSEINFKTKGKKFDLGKELVTSCLIQNPNKRMSINQIMNHKYFHNFYLVK